MPLDTEREQRQQAELIRLADTVAARGEQIRRQQEEIERLVNVLSDKGAIIAELKQQNKSLSRRLADQRAANMELHDVAEQWHAAYERTVDWALAMEAELLRHIDELEQPARPALPSHTCGCGGEVTAEAVAWADGQTWACVECVQRG